MAGVEQLTPAEWCDLLFADADGWLSFLVDDHGTMRAWWARNAAAVDTVVATAPSDIWLGCSTRAERLDKGRGGDVDCLEVPGLWLDIDVAGDHHKKTDLPPDRAAARDLLNDFALKPTAVIDSGGGIQAWWLFPEPLPAADVAEILPAWTFTWQEFGRARGWHVDNVFDLARVMRIPGTFNHKSDPPKPVRLVHLAPDRRYNLDDLDGYTLAPPEPAEPAVADGAAAERGLLTESAPGAAQRYDQAPPDVSDPVVHPQVEATGSRLAETAPGAPSPRAGDGATLLRAGDRFNATAHIGALLIQAGCVLDHVDRDGTAHYRAPHHAHDRTTGIVIYPTDASGSEHATVFSETFAGQHGLEVRRPYDAFGLFTHLQHHGDFRAAREAIAPWTDVPADLMDLVTPSELPETATLPSPGNVATDDSTERAIRAEMLKLEIRDEALRRYQAAQVAAAGGPENDGIFLTGGQFLFDDDAVELTARWGRDSDVLWATGESLMIVGPPGVGKTTIAQQLVGALIGLLPEVLGLPVEPAKRVLYLAMDRPSQIRRAMLRLFGPAVRPILDERLLVRRGPLPTDLAADPSLLVTMAQEHGCDAIVMDSLKDAAIQLTDDRVGGSVNRAIQWCNALGIDVLTLHHQRKGEQGTKPNTLSDVYGSAWLTAGTGSVILIWGEAGAEEQELIHLKQPLDPVGPLDLRHDHHRGTTKVVRPFDVLEFLRSCGPAGATPLDVAKAATGDDKVTGTSPARSRADRRLRGLCDRGLARRMAGDRDGGQFSSVRYVAVAKGDVGLEDLLPEPAADDPYNSVIHHDGNHDAPSAESTTTLTTTQDDFFT